MSKQDLEVRKEELAQRIRRFTWITDYGHRDMLLEEVCLEAESRGEWCSSEVIHLVKRVFLDERERRKSLPDEFVECPRCRGYHSEKENNNCLCERCEWIVHIFNWDIEHGVKKPA